MAGEVVVDALPYIDQGFDEPGVRDSAAALVDEECRRYRPTKNYLETVPPLNLTAFETPMMRAEFERLQNRLPMECLSMKRYELPPPPSGKLNEISAWNECVDNSCAQLEHQAVRILNLQLMLQYCCPAWQRYLSVLQEAEKIATRELQMLRQAIQEVNWQRKSLQTSGGEQLRDLESRWVQLVSHNYEIEQACTMAEEVLNNLQQQKQLQQQQQQKQEQRQQETVAKEDAQPEQTQTEVFEEQKAEEREAETKENNDDM